MINLAGFIADPIRDSWDGALCLLLQALLSRRPRTTNEDEAQGLLQAASDRGPCLASISFRTNDPDPFASRNPGEHLSSKRHELAGTPESRRQQRTLREVGDVNGQDRWGSVTSNGDSTLMDALRLCEVSPLRSRKTPCR